MKKSDTWPYWIEEDAHGATLKFNGTKVLHLPIRFSEGGGKEREYEFGLRHLHELVKAAQVTNGQHITLNDIGPNIVASMPRNTAADHLHSYDVTDVVEGNSVCEALVKLAEQLKREGRDYTADVYRTGYA